MSIPVSYAAVSEDGENRSTSTASALDPAFSSLSRLDVANSVTSDGALRQALQAHPSPLGGVEKMESSHGIIGGEFAGSDFPSQLYGILSSPLHDRVR